MRVVPCLCVLAAGLLLLSGCGGSCDSCGGHSVGVNMSGLVGSRLVLSNNGVTVSVDPGTNGPVPALFKGLAQGTAYNISVAVQPTTPSQTCVVANGTGTMGAVDVTNVSVTCTTTPARFLVAQGSFRTAPPCMTISAVDNSSGALSAPIAPPFCGPNGGIGLGYPFGPFGVAPLGKFLYISTIGGGLSERLYTVAIDPTTGAWSLEQTLDCAYCGYVAVDPSGQFLVMPNGFRGVGYGDLFTFKIDPSSGLLTDSGYRVHFDNEPWNVSVDPLGKFVYVTYGNFNEAVSVQALTLDPKTGALAQSAAAASVQDAFVLLPHPWGKFLYAVNRSNSIAIFKVDRTSGALTPITGSPVTAVTDSTTATLTAAVFHPNGKYLYVANDDSSGIYAFAVDPASGALTAIDGSPFPTGHSPQSVAIEPAGKFLYVSNDTGTSVYEIDSANGALTPAAGSPFAVAFGGIIRFIN